MTKVRACELKIGDKIMPPEREIRLWMARNCRERNLDPDTALQLTITEIEEGNPDKNGRWLRITGRPTPEWVANCVDKNPERHPFRFKARPDTPWPVL